MKKTSLSLLAWVAILASACGGSDDPTGPSGTGTQTMLVEASIEGVDQEGGFTTRFEVSLFDAEGEAIPEAVVTFAHAALDTVELEEQGAGSGVYAATAATYEPGDYTLDVVWGDERIEGAVVRGLEIHTIESPEAGATVPEAEPLTVTWTNASPSAMVRVETHDFATDPDEEIADTGSYTIPGEANPRRPQNQRIRVTRYAAVDIGGGLPGSTVQVSIRNTVSPISVR